MTKARILANTVSTGNVLADGTITAAKGGTGLNTPGAAGNVLTSNGTT